MIGSMTSEELARHQAFIADTVKVNGVPVVLTPYGVKKEIIEGQTYLVAMTLEERDAFLASAGIKPQGTCIYSVASGGCYMSSCNRCGYHDDDNAASCYCADHA